jgi:uncharacterized protein (TIGR04255 family)
MLLLAWEERDSQKLALRYERAPITEAVIDIRVEPLQAEKLVALSAIHESLRGSYPTRNDVVQQSIEVNDEGAISQRAQVGYRFVSQDGKRIVKAELDGFSYSCLQPYESWTEVSLAARQAWQAYQVMAGIDQIRRVAVRYINQIDIPELSFELRDYFRTVVDISPAWPQTLANFFVRLEVPAQEFGGTVIVTQTSTPPPNPSMSSLILDIDVIKSNPTFRSDDELWEFLEVLRQAKNRFFEGSITDKTRSLFGRAEQG